MQPARRTFCCWLMARVATERCLTQCGAKGRVTVLATVHGILANDCACSWERYDVATASAATNLTWVN